MLVTCYYFYSALFTPALHVPGLLCHSAFVVFTGWPKKFGTPFVRLITSSNIDQFLNFLSLSQSEKNL